MFVQTACVNTRKANLCRLNVPFWLLKCFYSHCRDVGYSFEAGGITDHLVQGTDNVAEARSYVTVLLPTVQHQLVQSTGAVHRWGQTVVLLDGVNHLVG